MWEKSKIYFHQIKRTFFYSLLLNIVYGFSGFFATIFTLTHGGPGYSTTTLDYLIYLRAFKYGHDLSCAYTISSMLLIIVVCLVTCLYLFFVKKEGEADEDYS